MFQYSSSPLSLKGSSIRLLCLLPHRDKNAPLRGYLFSYSPESNNATKVGSLGELQTARLSGASPLMLMRGISKAYGQV